MSKFNTDLVIIILKPFEMCVCVRFDWTSKQTGLPKNRHANESNEMQENNSSITIARLAKCKILHMYSITIQLRFDYYYETSWWSYQVANNNILLCVTKIKSA